MMICLLIPLFVWNRFERNVFIRAFMNQVLSGYHRLFFNFMFSHLDLPSLSSNDPSESGKLAAFAHRHHC